MLSEMHVSTKMVLHVILLERGILVFKSVCMQVYCGNPEDFRFVPFGDTYGDKR